jgi:hypothetical protein
MYQNLKQTNINLLESEEKYERKLTEGKSHLLVRLATNKYKMTCIVENKNIYMNNLLNFNLINLTYQTNLDQFEKFSLNMINHDEANVFLLMKHVFKEMGLKQRYICFDIKKVEIENGISFILTQNNECGEKMNDCVNAHSMPIKHMLCNFEVVSPHKLIITEYINFDPENGMPSILEPVFGLILKTMFKRTKQFIEAI